ncbi:hypothetical protein MMC17_010214 [Xylographa soralifera]|nr:hypothetical protein [Xylographa soralifera]
MLFFKLARLFPSTCFLIGASFLSPADSFPIVTIPSTKISYHGIAQGLLLETFLNIPFGQDTSGASRFAPPRKVFLPHGTSLDASEPGSACPQQPVPIVNFPLFSDITNLSEDCLNLRVTRPSNATEGSNLPVMVFIYGGGYSIGQIYDTLYTPDGLVTRSILNGSPIIFVAMNYRVNVFGFASSSALHEEGSLNAGLLDQRLGLEWVQDNIAFFGGDANAVTIFGESDGATSVGLQMTAYGGQRKVPFQQAIMQSGGPATETISWIVASNAFDAVVTGTNCSSFISDSARALVCMRSLTWEALQAAAYEVELETKPSFGFDVFFPVIDGTFLPDRPSKLVETGAFATNVPILVGWNENDGALFVPTTNFSTDVEVVAYMGKEWPGLSNKSTSALLLLYPDNEFEGVLETPQFYRTSQMFRDIKFACPLMDFSYQVAKHGSSVYLYVLNQTMFHNNRFLPLLFGVPHISDIPYVFNEAPELFLPISASDTALSTTMSGSWAAFAATGNPVLNAPASTLQNWDSAYSTNSPFNSNGPDIINIRVIGGIYDGPTLISINGTAGILSNEKILERCRLIGSLSAELMI